MATQIALLRGINLGNRRVQMAALRELLAASGYGEARTLLQSGNVVLESGLQPAALERALEKDLAAGLGFEVDVVVRTRDELAGVLERNPLRAVATDPARYLVTFLRSQPADDVVRHLDSLELEPERVSVNGREIYSWHPGGLARSELGKQLSERKLGVSGTGRNWATVDKLLALADT